MRMPRRAPDAGRVCPLHSAAERLSAASRAGQTACRPRIRFAFLRRVRTLPRLPEPAALRMPQRAPDAGRVCSLHSAAERLSAASRAGQTAPLYGAASAASPALRTYESKRQKDDFLMRKPSPPLQSRRPDRLPASALPAIRPEGIAAAPSSAGVRENRSVKASLPRQASGIAEKSSAAMDISSSVPMLRPEARRQASRPAPKSRRPRPDTHC